jgi:1-acyl-sn-glycerol-3-phosphate acyltransferase
MFETAGYYIGWIFVAVLAKILLRKSIIAYAPIPKGPKIIVANHPTVSDPFVLFSSMHERVSILIFDKVFSIPLFGRYLRMVGHIPVVRGNGQQAYDRALAFLKNGMSVLVFIEGGISPEEGGFAKPRTGAVRLACNSGAPIVPIGVGIHKKNIQHVQGVLGGEKMHEIWYFHGKYAITIGKHFHVTGNPNNRLKVQKATQRVMNQVIQLAQESTARIHA